MNQRFLKRFSLLLYSLIILNLHASVENPAGTVEASVEVAPVLSKDTLNEAYATSTAPQPGAKIHEDQILESTCLAVEPAIAKKEATTSVATDLSVEDILKAATEDSPTSTQNTSDEANRLQALKKQALEHFKELDVILEDLALRIENNQIKLADKKKAIGTIRILREVTQKVLARLYQLQMISAAEPKELEDIFQLWNKLSGEIQYLIEHKFESLKPDDTSTDTRSIITPSLEELEKLSRSIHTHSAQLRRQAEHIGRNFINRSFVAAERFWKRHKIGTKLLYTGAGLLAANWIYWRLDSDLVAWVLGVKPTIDLEAMPTDTLSEFLQAGISKTEESNFIYNKIFAEYAAWRAPNKIAQWLWNWKKFIGSKPWAFGRASGLEYTPRTEIGLLTTIDNLLGNSLGLCTLGVAGATPIVSTYVLPALKESAGLHLDSFLNWLSSVASFLRGGPVKEARERWEKDINVTLDDLIGHETARKEFQAIIDYMINYEQYDQLKVAPTKGVMLTGETRTGKTFTVKCFAGSLKRALVSAGKEDLRFFSFTAAEIEKYGIKNVFRFVSYYSPAVLFIDEFDTSGAQRDRNNTALCEYLEVLSELNEKSDKKVIVVAATNNPNNIDRALRAIGRLGKHIPFSLPTLEERREFLRRELIEKRAVVIDESVIEKLALETTNANYDGLTITVQKALLKAKIENTTLQPRHLEEAVNEEVHKILTEVPALEPNKARLVASHIASQALARILLKSHSMPGKITICPVNGEVIEQSVWQNNVLPKADVKNGGIDYGNIFLMESTEGRNIIDEAAMRKEIRILLAGHIGENIILNSFSIGYRTENQQKAFDLAKLIALKGLKSTDFSETELQKRLENAHEIIATAEEEVRALLKEHTDALAALTFALLKEKTLDIEAILGTICEVDPRIKTLLGFDELEKEIAAMQAQASTAEESVHATA